MAYIADLLSENTREAALLELSKKREQVPELALILWHSFGMTSFYFRSLLCPSAAPCLYILSFTPLNALLTEAYSRFSQVS